MVEWQGVEIVEGIACQVLGGDDDEALSRHSSKFSQDVDKNKSEKLTKDIYLDR